MVDTDGSSYKQFSVKKQQEFEDTKTLPLNKSIKRKLFIVNLAFTGVLAFFLIIILSMITHCGHWRLPDRSRCTIPWEQRPTCLSDNDCGREQLCAFRGNVIGRCTLVDCCDPWRNRRLENSYNSCNLKD